MCLLQIKIYQLLHLLKEKVQGLPAIVLIVLALFLSRPDVEALTIIRDFIGGAPGTNDTGSGNLSSIFNAAADLWEQIILDDHVLTLHYGWAPNGGGEHYLNAQGGVPNRETEGTILFNNDNVVGHHHYYLDPTPRSNEEFPYYTQIAQEMGGGPLNVTRFYSGGTGAAGSEDLFTVALHEIGHALGMSMINSSFIAESADGDLDITAPRPYAGTTVPLQTNLFGVTGHLRNDMADRVLMAGWGFGERVLPSTLDIIALAQCSQFQNLNFNLSPELAIRRAAKNVVLEWAPIIPGFVLQGNNDLRSTNWVTLQDPVAITNEVFSVNVSALETTKAFRLRMATNFGLTISTSNNAVDVNPGRGGIQVHAGTTVQYSASISNSAGTPFTWQWFYTVNEGPWNIVQTGSSATPTITFTYGAGSVGNTYVWTLMVFSGQQSAQSHSVITVE